MMSMHYLELAWDKIHYFHTLGKLAREFDKILVRRIFVHVIVTIFCALKLDYKAVGELIREPFRAVLFASSEGLDVRFL